MSQMEAEGDSLRATPRINDRHQASIELDNIIIQIRQLLSFGNFSLPPPVEELNAGAFAGPIILIDASKLSCDVFLIDADAF
ncbi:hypothetical protein BDP81DRAFT_442671 [Colletotrichum phormii]|uniref:Uncharacterized protein n=1 Tax=Colletotrichum phormii TaxID=359342 RepID=A0AAI9ZCA0_9PEZI|nr:uncharacterized protein BDP81DRAFT_442671 [Colletotrichum phormii]KAK1621863.1 hypothetical protein BDP81DRAFT_442671 [Colletotrichum phormii]